jgi:hypothetical protein
MILFVTSRWQNYLWLFCQRLVTTSNKKIAAKNHISCSEDWLKHWDCSIFV